MYEEEFSKDESGKKSDGEVDGKERRDGKKEELVEKEVRNSATN